MPGFLSSTASSAQLGSTRRLVPVDAIARKELVLERVVGQFPRQGPVQPNCRCALEIILHRTAGYSQYDGDLAGARPASGKPKHLS